MERSVVAGPDNPGNGLTPLPRHSLSDRVVTILKRYIVAENQVEGSRLPPERQMADTLNVSRTVLREALNRLLGEGVLRRSSPRILVVADPQKAAQSLSPIDAQEAEFQDLMELRIFLELGSIGAIVQRATPEQLGVIEHWVEEGERRVREGLPVHLADAGFHTALLRAANNRVVDTMSALVEEQLRSYLLFATGQIGHIRLEADMRVVGEHRQIYEALIAKDESTARRVMESHLGHYFARRSHASSDPAANS